MPRMDCTGPSGTGPMSGRGLGPCAGAMCSAGSGCRRRFIAPVNERLTLKDEKAMLERQLETIEQELKALVDK